MATKGQYSLYIRKTGDLWKSYGTFEKGKDIAKILLKLQPEPQDCRINFGSHYDYDYSYSDASITLDANWCCHRMTFEIDDLKEKNECPECGCNNYKGRMPADE